GTGRSVTAVMEGGQPVVIKESDVLESEFSKWKVALDNKMKADDLRKEIEGKKLFKEMQAQAKKERQERIQQEVKEQREAARLKRQMLRDANLEKGAAHKESSNKLKEAAVRERTAYAEAGYELTRLHGPEQARRTASRYVELAREKASFGQGGKEDRMALATQRIQQRTARLEEKRELVEKMKSDEGTNASEAKKYALEQKKAAAEMVRSQEKVWEEAKKSQKNNFLAQAKAHHGKIDHTKSRAKNVRKALQTKHQRIAARVTLRHPAGAVACATSFQSFLFSNRLSRILLRLPSDSQERDAAKQHEASLLDGDNSRAALVSPSTLHYPQI
ncbi:MAG: hypothetical protein SGPRY_010499, partial [Prymnesium sp.]